MFVTFFYAIDRTEWPKKWQRSISDYYVRFEELVKVLDGKHIIVYSNDPTIQTISQKYFHCRFIFKELQSFEVWNQRSFIQTALSKRWFSFNVPEFFSADYIALQLCKFQALHDSSLLTNDPKEPIIWIDAGLRSQHLNSQFHVNWTIDKIHATQFTALPFCERFITEFPGAFIMGGCFGGFGVQVRRLYKETSQILQELYANNRCANDQQVLSLLYWRKPNLFHLQKSFRQWIPFYGSPKWDNVLQILDSETNGYVKQFHILIMFSLILFIMLFKTKCYHRILP